MSGDCGAIADSIHDLIHFYHDLHQLDLEYMKLHKKRTEIMNRIGAIYDKEVLGGKSNQR